MGGKERMSKGGVRREGVEEGRGEDIGRAVHTYAHTRGKTPHQKSYQVSIRVNFTGLPMGFHLLSGCERRWRGRGRVCVCERVGGFVWGRPDALATTELGVGAAFSSRSRFIFLSPKAEREQTSCRAQCHRDNPKRGLL